MNTQIDQIIAEFLDRGRVGWKVQVPDSPTEQEAADLLAAMVTSPDDLTRFLSLGDDPDDEILPMIGMVLARRVSGSMAEVADANASLGGAIGRQVMRAANNFIHIQLEDPRHMDAACQRAQINFSASQVTQ